MQLRYYQDESISALYSYFMVNHGNPVVALPTGTGKSVIIAEFIRGIFQRYPGQRIMMLTHVKELIEQNFKTLIKMWATAPAGVYSSGMKRKQTNCPITFAGIASVHSKAEEFGHIDLVLIDECHLVSPNSSTMYSGFLAKLREKNPWMKVVGFSATPYRLGLGLITDGGLFTDICYDLTGMEAFNRLVAEGYLAPLVPKRTRMEYDTSDVKIQGGEFVQKDLQQAVDKDSLTYAAVQEMVEQGHDREHWLIFASGIEHAEHVGAALDSLGVPTVVIHSKMGDEARDTAIRDFKAGKYRAAVNNNVLTTGFDFPAIDLIGVLRPTASTGLWVQMLGRGTRPSPGKRNCLVLDFAGNTRKLGPINDPVIPKTRGKGGGGIAPVRVCESCGTYCHASLRQCPECGMEFPRELKINQTAFSDELIKTDAPVVDIFKVDRVTYAEHNKMGRPPTMQVTYYCGLRQFKEWICFEHPGFPGKKARGWWRERTGKDAPMTTAEAIARMDELKVPEAIRVWINKQYPEILGANYE